MKQLIQSFRTGELGIFEVPAPFCHENGVLVATSASLVSAGTEKMIVEMGKKSLLGKVRARPDLVGQILEKMKKEGFSSTMEKVFARLDTPVPLGYSCAGRVLEVGRSVSGITVGDRVACGGAGYASHAEINYIPRNLFCRIPDNVDDRQASFVTVGAIALQGVRQADPKIGEKVAVIGLGLIGQLTVQLLKASGCHVIGSDMDVHRQTLAESLGADRVCSASDLVGACDAFSQGAGVDSVIITASTSSHQPIQDAGEIARMKGRVVVVGQVGLDVPRNVYYKKELDIRLSMAYGPGRYDAEYEEAGIDYPYPYVRWTEQRNFEAFLDLVSAGRVCVKDLITHSFDFSQSLKAYDLLEGRAREAYLGIVLTYSSKMDKKKSDFLEMPYTTRASSALKIGLVGAGSFAKSVILPTLSKVGGFEWVGLAALTGLTCQAVGKKYGFRFMTTDTKKLIENEDINAVIIASRHNHHAAAVWEALNAGKHVFVEKPLCLREDELEKIRQVYENISVRPVLQVGFNRRFAPLMKDMKAVLQKGPLNMMYRVNAGIVPGGHWIQDVNTGGGRIIGEVCHFVDTCAYVTGSRVVKVYAQCMKKDDSSVPDEDNVHITLSFADGSVATIGYFAYGDRMMPKEYIEVLGRDIALQLNDFRTLLIYEKGRMRKISKGSQDKGFKGEFEAFKNAITKGESPVLFASLYNTTLTTFKILESIKIHAPIEF
jgi:predicted dehydrogenase